MIKPKKGKKKLIKYNCPLFDIFLGIYISQPSSPTNDNLWNQIFVFKNVINLPLANGKDFFEKNLF